MARLTIHPAATAIVLIEFQKQWTMPGLYHALIRREMVSRNVLDNTAALTVAARAAGVPVIHAPLVIDPVNKRGLFAYLTAGLVFRKGTTRAEIEPRVFAASDRIARGRYAFDAFVGSDLEDLMRRSGRRQFLFAGFTADQCVGKTIATALAKGFDAYLLTDCCATLTALFHRRTERSLAGKVVTARQVIDLLAPSASVSPRV